jgi:hypothetical protein
VKTSRLSTRYRVHLVQLRTCAYMINDAAERAKLLDAIQALAGDLAMGFAPTEQLTLEEARVADGVADLLDDSAPVTSSDRDSRPVAAE